MLSQASSFYGGWVRECGGAHTCTHLIHKYNGADDENGDSSQHYIIFLFPFALLSYELRFQRKQKNCRVVLDYTTSIYDGCSVICVKYRVKSIATGSLVHLQRK